MATTSTGIADLYSEIVADLIPFYDNQVLLPNPQLIANQYNIEGAVGNQLQLPITNSWTGNVSAQSEGSNIITDNAQDFGPDAVLLSMTKRGAGTYVNTEALEDGGFNTVRNAVVTRLSRSIAQATDKVGFNTLASGSGADLTDISGVDLSNDSGLANTDLTTADVSFIMSPEAMAYGVKRQPTVKMFEDIEKDQYQMVASLRNGFARTPSFTGANIAVGVQMARALIASDSIGETNANLRASLDMVSTSVAELRKMNAPTDDSGFYAAVVSSAHEFHLAKELNGVGGISSGSIGSISQDLANQALLEGLIGQAVGCRFYRSNNVPSGLASA
jgi:hypothetical protein